MALSLATRAASRSMMGRMSTQQRLVRSSPLAAPTKRGLCDAHHAHHVETMDLWKKISMGCVPVLGLMTIYNIGVHMSHDHHHDDGHEQMNYSYQKIRTKEYPWAERDCSFFDWECKRAWHAAKK